MGLVINWDQFQTQLRLWDYVGTLKTILSALNNIKHCSKKIFLPRNGELVQLSHQSLMSMERSNHISYEGKVILSETWEYEKPEDSSEHPNGPSTNPPKLSWDEPLPTHLDKEFRNWINDIEIIAKYKVKRYLFGNSEKRYEKSPQRQEVEIHVFSDGGKHGCVIVIYARWEDGLGKFHMRRIFSVSWVVSLSSTIPVPQYLDDN